MFAAQRNYTNLALADLAPLAADIKTLLGNNGFTIQPPGPTGFIENGRADAQGPLNWDIDSQLAMTADDWSYVGGYGFAPNNNDQTTGLPLGTCEVVVAGDAREGWFWVMLMDHQAGVLASLTAAVQLRPHAADEDAGLLRRWGVLFVNRGAPARLLLPGARLTDGGGRGEIICGLWSPLSGSLRHAAVPPTVPASSLPRMIAPLFADPSMLPQEFAANQPSFIVTACVPGELDCVMRATDGYGFGEQAAPNWHVYGDTTIGFYALRRPATLTTF